MSDIPADILSRAREIYESAWPDPVAAIAEALMEEREGAAIKASIAVEMSGEDVLIKTTVLRSSTVLIPAGILPDFVKSLQQILHEQQEVESI